jgi:uncharacterized protein
VDLVNKFIEICNLFGYGEIRETHYSLMSTLLSAYGRIDNKKFVSVTISDKSEVYPALRKFFSTSDADRAVV